MLLSVLAPVCGRVLDPITVADIDSITILDATEIDDDGAGNGVDPNGWVAVVEMPYIEGATIDASKIVFSVTDPGFDTTGAAVNRTRTIRGTVRLRKQEPNAAAKQDSNDGTTETVYIALETWIYAGSTVTAEAEEGFYGAATPGAVSSVTNSSTAAYPKPKVAWLNLQKERATGSTFYVEMEAYHRHAMNGQQIAAIGFVGKDGTHTTAEQISGAPILSTLQTKGNIVECYAASIPLVNLDQASGATPTHCSVNATIYPWIGDAFDVEVDGPGWSLGEGLATAQPNVPLLFINDKDATWGGCVAFVKAGVTGGTVGLESDLASARATPFPTIQAAATAIAAYNAANKGHNNHSGSKIYLMDLNGADQSYELGASVSAADKPTCWFDIEPDPANTAEAYYAQTVLRAVPSCTRFRNLRVDKNGTAGVFDGSNATLYNDSMIAVDGGEVNLNAGTTTPWITNAGLIYYRNLNMFQHSGGGTYVPSLAYHSTGSIRAAMILGVVYDSTVGATVYPYMMTGCAGSFGIQDPSTTRQSTNDGVVISNNRLHRIGSVTGLARGSGTFPYDVYGLAFAQNVLEMVDAAAFSIGGDSGAVPIVDAVIQYNTAPSDPNDVDTELGRFNHLYADVAAAVGVRKIGTFFLNLFARYATKTDTFDYPGEGTGRVGNWERHYGVGCFGNGIMIDRAPSESGDSWSGMWWDACSKNNMGVVPFTDNKAGVDAAGNGTYTLVGEDNPARNCVAAGRAQLKYDLAGVERANDGSGACGAYEYA